MNTSAQTAAEPSFERSSVGSNITAMYALQIANYIIPLLSLPYLIRVLGAHQYGVMAMAYATVFFLVLFIDAGFNTRAVKLLSRADISRAEINEIYASTQWLKVAQTLLAFIILVSLIYTVPQINEHSTVYLATFGIVMGSLLFPTWLFQGLQVMHYTTMCSVSGRVIATAGIFIWVKSPDDLVLAAALQASATVISGLLSMPLIRRKFSLSLRIPAKRLIPLVRNALKDGRELSVSEYIINATSNAGVFILGLFASESVVGIFAAISKVGQAGANAFQPLLKSLFPAISRQWTKDTSVAFDYTKLWTQRIGFSALLSSIALFFLSSFVLEILFGQEWAIHGGFLQGLSLWLLLFVIASAVGQFWLLARGFKTQYSMCLLATGLVQVTACFVGAIYFGIIGVIGAVIFSELCRLIFFIVALANHPVESK